MRFSTSDFQRRAVCLAVVFICFAAHAFGADWPAWRHDARRSAVTSEELPAELHLRWKLSLPELEPAWPDQDRLRFDVAYAPIVKGKTLFVASPRSDSVTAYHTETGEEKWKFYTNGPVRFAPAAWKDKVYFTSDDGHLYCLQASDGKLAWKFRGAPTDRLVLGNKRLISMWPARAAPVIADGKIYFGAGIWPMMGVFLYALDAETGEIVWRNDALGPAWTLQPHDSPAFACIAPQGYLAAVGDRLLVPGGRSVPASIDRRTGKLEYYHLAKTDKIGGFAVTASNEFFHSGGRLFNIKGGSGGARLHDRCLHSRDERLNPIFCGDSLYAMAGGKLRGYKVAPRETGNRRRSTWMGPGVTELWSIEAGDRLHLKAGSRLFTSDDNTIYSVDIVAAGNEEVTTRAFTIDSPPENMIAADGKLFVSTLDGSIHCYGTGPRKGPPPTESVVMSGDDVDARARSILDATGVEGGYCLALGLRDGRMLADIARASDLHVIGIDADAEKVERIRRRLDLPRLRGHVAQPAGRLYGKKIALIVADPLKVQLPPYLASLIVSEDLRSGGFEAGQAFVSKVFHSLRPFGGVACLEVPGNRHSTFARHVGSAKLAGAVVGRKGRFTTLAREGALSGSADWTHQYADAANTVVSKDRLVKLPLGVLWFGGSTHYNILPRHGHGPAEQVVDGRLFIEGPDTMRATDVYTGRVLWEVNLPGLGEAYDNTLHQPGANSLGSNYASARDGIYVVHDGKCLRLDPATGETISTFTVPREPGSEETAAFAFVAIEGDLLIAAASPMSFEWNPVFRKEGFQWCWADKGKREEIIAAIDEWTGRPYVIREDAESDLDYVVRNANELLDETSLASRMPEKILRTRGATIEAKAVRREIAAYLRTRKGTVKYDTTLRSLNRRLLHELYPVMPGKSRRGHIGYYNWDHTASRTIVVMNRHTGRELWRRDAVHAFRHNAIVAGGGMVFCIDRLPDSELRVMKRRGYAPEEDARLSALDLRTGRVVWEKTEGVFGTWLGYSRKEDVLLQSGRPSRDMLPNEPRTMSACRGSDGEALWADVDYSSGPCMIHGKKIITASEAFSLPTGERVNWKNPLTGVAEKWGYRRMYGCNSPVASEHMLMFRSAAAGFYDLEGMGGTGNFGGFKSGCTSNLVAAGGVLNAPDYTRTCTCSYQNQTSLALVHMPEVEVWTFNSFGVGPNRIRRLGVNLGAPGDRRTGDGTLWLEHPRVGGPSPNVTVASAPDDVDWFYRHSSRMSGGGPRWVAASGGRGISELTVTLDGGTGVLPWMPLGVTARSYTVRLYFAEPDSLKPGERIFDVAIQGRTALRNFDVVAEAGGPNRLVVREFRGVKVHGKLRVELAPARAAKVRRTLLCGIKVTAEGW